MYILPHATYGLSSAFWMLGTLNLSKFTDKFVKIKEIIDSMGRTRVWNFNERQENVHDGERSGQPSLIDDLFAYVEEKISYYDTVNVFSSDLLFASSWNWFDKTKLSKTVCSAGIERSHRTARNEKSGPRTPVFDTVTTRMITSQVVQSLGMRPVCITYLWIKKKAINGMKAHVTPIKTKSQSAKTCWKIMYTVLWDRHGI